MVPSVRFTGSLQGIPHGPRTGCCHQTAVLVQVDMRNLGRFPLPQYWWPARLWYCAVEEIWFIRLSFFVGHEQSEEERLIRGAE